MEIITFLNSVNAVVINPLITLVFAISFLIFFWGLFQFIQSPDEEREVGKRKIVYGLIGMLVMFGAYGLIRVVLGTFGVNSPAYISHQ